MYYTATKIGTCRVTAKGAEIRCFVFKSRQSQCNTVEPYIFVGDNSAINAVININSREPINS